MKKLPGILYWFVRLVAAAIMLQTLYFKFTGAKESVYIFSTIGMEPWGRIGVGVLELAASVLLLVNATAWLGGALGFALMAGALFMHLTVLGISVENDGGYLFSLALITLACCAVVLIRNRETMAGMLRKYY